MHNSILVSHSESLVADGEYATVGTDKYFFNTEVYIAQDDI